MSFNLVSRAYNHFTIDEEAGIITKQSDNQRIRNEIWYYNNIPDSFKKWFPRVISTDENTGTIKLEYYPSQNLGSHLMKSPPLTSVQWCTILSTIYDILEEWADLVYEPIFPARQSWKHGYDMYVVKTYEQYYAFVNQKIWPELFRNEYIIYNNKEYVNFEAIWKMYTKNYIQDKLLSNISFSFIHGDFCFANILYGNDTIKFVDPRGSFGEVGVFGDPRYDIAKLSHSIYGKYELLNTNNFTLKYDHNEWEVHWTANSESLGALFDKTFFSGGNARSRKEIRTIEGLIFIGACARHYESPQRQAALYLRGIQALNEAMHMGD